MQATRELKVNLAIGICSPEYWRSDFGMCLTKLMVDMLTSEARGVRFEYIRVFKKEGSMLARMRQEIVESVLAAGSFSHLLFVDTDQTFPADTARRLVKWDVPVVACNIAVKKMPSNPTARLPGHKVLWTRPGDSGLVEVWRVGTGIMMIEMGVFSKLPKPWFMDTWKPGGQFCGEDWFFCEQLEAAHIPIYIDQGLSLEVGHVGKYIYDMDLVEQQLKMQEVLGAEEIGREIEAQGAEARA